MAIKKTKQSEMSQAQEEEMSSALIAQLLAEDAMAAGGEDYYAEYSNDATSYQQFHREDRDGSYAEDSEDDSYAPKRNNSKNKGKGRGKAKSTKAETAARRGRKRKSEPEAFDLTNKSLPAPKAETAATTEATAEPKNITDTSTKPDDINNDPTKKINEIVTEATAGPRSGSPTEDLTSGKQLSKKPRRPVPEGFNSGVYSEEEERRFVEGLELFGREWIKVAAHIATRDANSIRSHAQKHLIKLFRDNIPLPAKVRLTGEGYTLSGKPLDPNSSAAKPYLIRNSMGDNESPAKPVPTQTKVEMMDVDTTDPTNIENKPVLQPSTKPENTKKVPKSEKPTSSTLTSTKAPVERVPPSPTVSSLTEIHTNEPKESFERRVRIPSAYDKNGRTTYSKSRLRQPSDRNSVTYSQLNKDDDPLTMVKCEPYNGKPGSNGYGAQPFEISVHSNVLLSMDFHAHLMTTEIIGFLAGEWDSARKHMCIREAYPCRSLNTGQNDVNVEMDPTSAIETRQLIEEKNMTVVGWYHSHPTFIPDPSLVDIENQNNYQVLCRETCDHEQEGPFKQTVEPFVGAIVGPYDPRLPGSASVINWFCVGNSPEDRGMPKRLIYELEEDECLSQEHENRMLQLLEIYKKSPEKVDFGDFWRQDAMESKLKKLIRSLGTRMPWVQKKLNQKKVQDDETTTDTTMNMNMDIDEPKSDIPKSDTSVEPFLEKLQSVLISW
ncbi:Homeodomain-like DNA binding domain-containing transcription factor [Phycomyces blakesleeanus NRRL 1555(-)]|uniref:Homeodomain-like DNA binding domain-containing transcription factor n=1 Tax=Phycomyces blakesleeanus (strain ATCC 8743b / DSM 1359 / FGSC 10004 / NBRC 33097 / NRRL 1555) TaxID=763407 RepID=A0A167NUV2_PHYB8|nr:Homeodomain-like DNA binding domain-containing transcription factor [Phycomyces blakesleeanus NRRL 1555(-)]OAD76659.1 Homeodomain-like DNA binding domain-containing transcription factor [Phycomyces blakesleeanus NRRL 1555(-)]|eukprot:XP_018294699.1 Homeodomain-like DNA binding domain-containing transcription factor [Phycomyces blakesleeanus NRRL 1555(-)]